jgi:hypothetical protein
MRGVRGVRPLAGLVTCALAARAWAQAPAPDPNEPALTLAVSPSETPPGGTITVSGLTYPQPGVQVLVTITPPGGGPTSLSATPDTSGRYRVTFSRTSSHGVYGVSAQMGPKSASAHAEFKVDELLIDIGADVADDKRLLQEAAELVTTLRRQVDDVPDSPAKSEMEAKLDRLEAGATPVAEQAAQLSQVLVPYQNLVAERPDAEPTLQALFFHLAQLDRDAKAYVEQVAKEIAQSGKGVKTCDAIDHATLGLKAVPELIQIAKRPWQFAAAYATNIAKSELPPEAGPGAQAVGDLVKNLPAAAGSPARTLAENELVLGSETEIAQELVARIPESVRATAGYRFAVTETRRFVPRIVSGAKSPLDLLDKQMLLAEDVAAFASEQLFARYCQKFEGGFTATMLAHFYSKPNGEGKPTEWWTYSTAIKGKLVLRYPREASGRAVELSGQFEGGATRFTYSQNVFSTDLFGAMAKGGTVYYKDTAPAATDNATGGLVNLITSPTSFYVPVTGQYADGKITIAMGDARADFNEAYTVAHTFYVVIAPTTMMFPIMGHFSLPYTNARFILNHVGKGDFPVVTKGQSLVIEKNARQDFPANQNLAVYTINLTACNPACAKE